MAAMGLHVECNPWMRRCRLDHRVRPDDPAGDETIVPPHLARDYEHADEVLMIAVRKTNPKTNQLGWTALGKVETN